MALHSVTRTETEVVDLSLMDYYLQYEDLNSRLDIYDTRITPALVGPMTAEQVQASRVLLFVRHEFFQDEYYCCDREIDYPEYPMDYEF
jgi:hypothetical protein